MREQPSLAIASVPENCQASSTTSSNMAEGLSLGYIIDQIKERVRKAISTERLSDPETNVVEVNLAGISGYNHSDVLANIHEMFVAERIDQRLFIKFDGGDKERIHRRVANSLEAQLPAWFVEPNTICVVNGNEFRPDVGAWNPAPTRLQRRFPIIHQCPPPLVWVEVAWDDSDRSNVIRKFTTLLPLCPNTEFVMIALPHTGVQYPANPNPGAPSVAIGAPLPARPQGVLYASYWPLGAAIGAEQWHNIQWNRHLPLVNGAIIDFNIILDVLAL